MSFDVLRSAALALTILVALANINYAKVPTPAETPVDVIVNGRTSTLKSIVVKKLGQTIPPIFAGEFHAKNTPGFNWYVSQHFALKTEMDEAHARHCLEISELAYPHMIKVIGREPPGIEHKRMALQFAKNFDRLQDAVRSDLNGIPYGGGGGGVTLPASWVAYNYKSGGLAYHLNDLVVHENLHLTQLTVQGSFRMPLRFVEGITHMFCNHVYDRDKKQLTIGVFDKAPINNPVDRCFTIMKEKGNYKIQDLVNIERPGDYPHPETLWTAFHWSDPERTMKWRLWRDELFDKNVAGKDALKKLDVATTKRLHNGSLEGFEREFQKWINERQTTYTHKSWGWEQWGGVLQSYGWPGKGNHFSQMNLNYKPGTPTKYDPLRLDFPYPDKPDIVGKVKFGGPTPTVGAVIDFNKQKNGYVGLGLGVDGNKALRVVINQNKELVIDGGLLGFAAGKKSFPFTPEILAAAQATQTTGITAAIKSNALEVTVRAKHNDKIHSMKGSYPIKANERKALLTRVMAAISRDARHHITPFMDWKLKPTRDVTVPAPPNRWLFDGDDQLYALYRAAWVMGNKAPTSLTGLRDSMIKTMGGSKADQAKGMANYAKRIKSVISDVKAVGGKAANDGLAQLSGVSMIARFNPSDKSSNTAIWTYLRNYNDTPIKGKLHISASPSHALKTTRSQSFTVGTSEYFNESKPQLSGKHAGAFTIEVTAEYTWRGHSIRQTKVLEANPTIPHYWTIGPFDNKGEGTVDTFQPVESDEFDAQKTYPGLNGGTASWKKAIRPASLGLPQEHIVNFRDTIGDLKNCSAYALVWVESPKAMDALLTSGADDGFVAWVNDKRVSSHLRNGGYGSRNFNDPIKLKKGKNKLLIRITQTWGGWQFASDIVTPEGKSIPGLKYSLTP